MGTDFVEELRWRGMVQDITPGTEELLRKELVTGYIEHFDDALMADHPFGNTGKKTISFEVIEPVHIKLSRNELMKEFFFMPPLEDSDCHCQGTIHFPIESFHE